MAPLDLTPVVRHEGVDHGVAADPREAALTIRRPAELAELAEVLYRGVFGAGLVVAATATVATLLLAPLQPAGGRRVAIAVCSLLLLGQLVAVWQRARLYPALRRRPSLVLLPALALGAGAWGIGQHNQLLFYVLAILLGVMGAAVPLRLIALASLVAATGMACPQVIDGGAAIGVAGAAGVLPPLFWLIIEQLARFMLRLDPAEVPERARQSAPAKGRTRRGTSHHRQASTGSGALDERPRQLKRGAPPPRDHDLTARQLQVLLLCAEGLQHREIGTCLQIGAVQVGRHLRTACLRANVASNAELVAWAIRRGLIPLSQTNDPPPTVTPHPTVVIETIPDRSG